MDIHPPSGQEMLQVAFWTDGLPQELVKNMYSCTAGLYQQPPPLHAAEAKAAAFWLWHVGDCVMFPSI